MVNHESAADELVALLVEVCIVVDVVNDLGCLEVKPESDLGVGALDEGEEFGDLEEELGDVERGGFDLRGGGVVVVAGSFGKSEERVYFVDELEQKENEGRNCVPHALLTTRF